MKIGIANDHRGVNRKNDIMKYLNRKKYEVIDFGTNTSESVDYPIYAFELAKKVSHKEIDFGILLCGTGVGMCIAANKVDGIRCAKVDNINDAKLTRLHNDANMLALSSEISLIRTKDILDVFLKTKFSEEERHIRRISMINSYIKESALEENDYSMNKEQIQVENNIEESSTIAVKENDN